jgi:hypothetical protein
LQEQRVNARAHTHTNTHTHTHTHTHTVKRKEEIARRAAQKNAAVNPLQAIPDSQRLEVVHVHVHYKYICKYMHTYKYAIRT